MVLYSTKQSLENREVSFLAIIEIVFAVWIYWYIAYHFDFYWHVIISLIVVPLFLLSSKESIALSLRWTDYYSRNISDRFFYIFIYSILFIIIIAVMSGLPAFYSAVFGVPIAIILSFLLIKFISILIYIVEGYRNLTKNWIYYNFIQDIKKIPEIVEGAEDDKTFNSEFKLSEFRSMISDESSLDKIVGIIIYVTFYTFAIFYRLSIKSTFWFYMPLLLVVKTPNLKNSQEIGRFLSEQYQTIWAWLRGLLAIGTLIAFFVTYFQYYAFREVGNIPFVSIISMLYLDFSSIEVWKIFQLLVAVLTIGLFLYSNAIRVPAVSNDIKLENDYRIKIIYYVNSLRNWISLFYFVSAFLFLAYYFQVWEYKYVPKFMKIFLLNALQFIQFKPFG